MPRTVIYDKLDLKAINLRLEGQQLSRVDMFYSVFEPGGLFYSKEMTLELPDLSLSEKKSLAAFITRLSTLCQQRENV